MLEFDVMNQTLIRTDKFKPATDSAQYLKAKFTFTEDDWSGKTKIALFRVGTTAYEAFVDNNNVCVVPAEALAYVGHQRNRTMGCVMYVSLIGEYGTMRITTNEIEVKMNASGYGDNVTPEEPSETVYDQIISAYAECTEDVNTALTACEEAEANFNTAKETFGGLFANAIKGNISGTVVAANDVSPVEHELDVLVHGKNLFDTSTVPVQPSTYDIYISEVGEGYIDVTTQGTYDGNGHCVTSVKLKELCPSLQEGKQYALSATTDAWNKMIYLKEIDLFWNYGARKIVTKEMLECTIGFYGLNVIREQGIGTCRISNIQMEEGYEITAYTPYIEPSNVTVRRCGKNLTCYPYKETSKTRAGITYTVKTNGIIEIDGTSTGSYFGISAKADTSIYLNKGIEYTMSGLPSGSGMDTLYAYITESDGTQHFVGEGKTTFTANSSGYVGFTVVVPNGITATNRVVKPMLEIGGIATDFETYNGAEFTPSTDGKVSGITSLSPNITMLSDTEGITIDCEYVKDTNKVIGKLVDAIEALGGTVTI